MEGEAADLRIHKRGHYNATPRQLNKEGRFQTA
jgi:hypothetical protein